MKFLSIYKNVERNTPPSPEEMASMGKLIEQGFREGWLVATEGCLPSKLGARVRDTRQQHQRDRRPVHRIQRSRRRIRNPEGQLEGRSDSTCERLPEDCRRRRVRIAADL